MLYLIGLGLKAKDLTLEGLEILGKIDTIFYEDYTSIVGWIPELEGIVGKKFRRLGRSELEENSKSLIELAAFKDIAVLVSGDPLSATTHLSLCEEAKSRGVRCVVVHAPSVLLAVAETGLWLYKFGRVVTIPKQGKLESVKEFIDKNRKIGLHTLILLDIGMTAAEGVARLLDEKIIDKKTMLVACSRIGGPEAKIIYSPAEDLLKKNLGSHPHCLVLPGTLHFTEQEALAPLRPSGLPPF